MTTDREDFLGRWSRLKRTHREEGDAAANETPADAGAPPATEEAAVAPPSPEPAPLPDPSTLTAGSDFTPFLRPDVPEDVHRQAMRALWRSDPILTADDGLSDYHEDYSSIGIVSMTVQTAYRVGRGFLDAVEQAADDAGASGETASPMAAAPAAADADDRSGRGGEAAGDVEGTSEPDPAEPPEG
jgi:hypothetical protein